MLVVGGIQPRNDNIQPEDLSGCDSSSRFSQGLGIFSLNDHSWKTNYDPKDGAAAYQVHSSISAVIGGDENGGATTTTPSGGFSVPALGSLLTLNQSSNTTTPSSTPGSTSTSSPAATSAAPANKKISGGAIAGIAIGAVVVICGLVGALIFLMLRRKRGQHSQPPPPSSAPIGRLGEMDAITHPTEMPGPRAEKALPEKPDDYTYRPQELMSEQKPAAGTAEQNGLLEPQEMDAQGGPERRGTPRGYRPY